MANPPQRESSRPEWDTLLELANSQAGYFTTAQARDFGFSPELLIHHRKRGRLERVRRGIYRVRHLPPQEGEQLVELWLWSGREGVYSHGTALALYDLSDILPSSLEMTVPASWRRRRLRVPDLLRLHYADVPPAERGWVGFVPVTSPLRALGDCVASSLSKDMIRQAVEQGIAQGRFAESEVADVIAWLGGRLGDAR
jgi:predicted transcriptional regulator of viral defense system